MKWVSAIQFISKEIDYINTLCAVCFIVFSLSLLFFIYCCSGYLWNALSSFQIKFFFRTGFRQNVKSMRLIEDFLQAQSTMSGDFRD